MARSDSLAIRPGSATLTKKQKFVITIEFNILGEHYDNVVTSCPELNIHTVDNSLQGATLKLAEAIRFFFDTADSRQELEEVVEELAKSGRVKPPWTGVG